MEHSIYKVHVDYHNVDKEPLLQQIEKVAI
jgi:hypothetical protein